MADIRWPVTRRDFVATSIAGAAGAYALTDPLLASALRKVPRVRDAHFGAGVASGQVGQRAITLWTQLDGVDRNARIDVEIATDDGFGRVLHSEQVLVDAADGASTARIRFTNAPFLRPGERYSYRFSSADGTSDIGHFRTALPPSSKEKVRIAFITCQDFVSGYYVAHKDLLSQDVDLVVSLGDYIYETAFFAGGVRKVPETPDGSLRLLDEYRTQYRTYHSDESLRAVRAMAPMQVIWDDHEVQDNYAGDKPGHEWKEGGRTNVPFLTRRANAYQAFFENHPIVRDPVEADRTYAAQRIGCVDLLQLDLRQYKTDQPCNPEDGPFAFCTDASEATNPNNTILGTTQRNWMLNRLKSSKAEWKLIANQVMMMSNDILPGYTFDTEGWDGYANDRMILCDWLTQNNIKNTHVITGDVHMFYAGGVTRTGRRADIPFGGLAGGPTVMSEFVVGAMTSQGISDRVSGELAELGYQIQQFFSPGSPRYTDEPFRNGVAKIVDDFLSGMNPHWQYANSSYKGYGIVEVTPSTKTTRQSTALPARGAKPVNNTTVTVPGTMKVKFRATHDVKLPNSTPFTLASFTINAGSPELQVDATAAQRRVALPIDRNVPLTQSNVRDYILRNAGH